MKHFIRTAALAFLVLTTTVPAQADMIDFIAESMWSEACAHPDTREGARWIALTRTEWCEEFVGDFGRVHSMCRPIVWTPGEANRFQVLYTDTNVLHTVELVAPNRLSITFMAEGGRVQQSVLGRARVNPNVETLHVQCR